MNMTVFHLEPQVICVKQAPSLSLIFKSSYSHFLITRADKFARVSKKPNIFMLSETYKNCKKVCPFDGC